eukprot:1181913-Pleurochrysis_carterae.AAC.3
MQTSSQLRFHRLVELSCFSHSVFSHIPSLLLSMKVLSAVSGYIISKLSESSSADGTTRFQQAWRKRPQ